MATKKAQVTVFIILGIVIFATISFLFFTVGSYQKNQLQAASEDVLTKLFGREGLRLFVDNCFEDVLVDGMHLIGHQGRIWADQPGGTLPFSNTINGVTHTNALGDFNLYYGITFEESLEFPNSYPCITQTNNSPEFCKYKAGDPASFGKKRGIGFTEIENDLARYLKVETQSCVRNFLETDHGISSNIQEDEVSISVSLESDGISVAAEYPLELNVDGRVYFHLSTFDFFYSTDFKSFLQTGVINPLIDERTDISFSYSESDLNVSETYRDISPTLVKEFTDSGDTVYQFSFDQNAIITGEDYLFQFAVENRPPALNYIQRESCDQYDYLVIPGDVDLGSITFRPSSSDPDENSIHYELEVDPTLGLYLANSNNMTFVDATIPPTFSLSGVYNLTVKSVDEFGEFDEQVVRTLVDRNVEVNISLRTPYQIFTGVPLRVSLEDPVFVEVTMPTKSFAPDRPTESLIINYDGNNNDNFSTSLPVNDQTEKCVSLPSAGDTYTLCSEDDYVGLIDSVSWDNILSLPQDTNPHFTKISELGGSGFGFGVLDVIFTSNYCSTFSQTEAAQAFVQVDECIVHANDTNPYPAPYHQIRVNTTTGERDINIEANPFLADHACCELQDGRGVYKSNTETCYTSLPDCYSNVANWPDIDGGYVFTEQVDKCSGTRGNVCSSVVEVQVANNKLTCGTSDGTQCSTQYIPDVCEGQDAYGYVDSDPTDSVASNDAWCHGTMGCSQVCTDVVVSLNGEFALPFGMDMNAYALTQNANSDTDGNFQFVCGCNSLGAAGNPYDSDFDGQFDDGVCPTPVLE